tara:strand:+ start:2258 stop:2419 length:162 start_codon:yes stop_codon:yes gene_type:complete
MNKLDKKLVDYKTICCNDSVYVKSRAVIMCKSCHKDVTLQAVLFVQAIQKEDE